MRLLRSSQNTIMEPDISRAPLVAEWKPSVSKLTPFIDGLQVVAFCHTLQDFPISKPDSLGKVLATARGFHMGGTDCSLPMTYARQQGLDVDAFIILTDSETCMPLLHSPLKT